MSTPKEIIFDVEAREFLQRGIKQLADIVAFTLGPKGLNVGLEKSWGAPTITNDGNSIVKDVTLKNTYENMGVSMAKEVVQKIKEKCGDGTTSGIVLLRALVDAGLKFIASGASPISVKRGMDKAIETIIQTLDKAAIPVKGDKEIEQIATASASGRADIGALIAEAQAKVGRSGVVTIEEAKGTETTIEVVEGMQFDRGYISPYFCTNLDRMTAEMTGAQVLVVDRKINNVHELLPVLQATAASGSELLIIAEDIEGDALSTLVVNKLRGALKVIAVKAPGFGDRRKAMMQDIAILTGATVISDDTGESVKDIPATALGSAAKVTVTKEHTTIVSGGGTESAVKARVKQLENEIAQSKNSWDKEKLEERKAKLSGGVAVIRVGAATEPELKQKKQMFEDSLNSTKAAIEEGIVPGGGLALLRAGESLKTLKAEGDEQLGIKCVLTACEAPIRQIISNTGFDGPVVLEEVKKASSNFGFNALNGKIEDLLSVGVMDPAKVVKNSLMHAASVAGIVLISEALIADAPEDNDEA